MSKSADEDANFLEIFAKYMLQLLWAREVESAKASLKDDDVYDFFKEAFFLNGIDIDDETIEYEFFELLEAGYLQETNAGFSLSPKGKCTAEETFETLKVLIPAPVASQNVPTAGKTAGENKRRTPSQRARALDKGIVAYFYCKLIKETKTRTQIEDELGLGQGALSDKDYAKPLMAEIKTMLHGAPKTNDFKRAGDIEINQFHTMLHKFLWTTLKEAKKDLLLKKLQATVAPKNAEEDTLDDER